MPLDPGPAAVAAIVAGLLMLAVPPVVSALRGARIQLSLPLMWGAILQIPRLPPRAVGTAIHLGVSVAVGLLYALAFQILGVRDPLLLWGLVGAVVHWIAGGLVLGFVPALHGDVAATPERRPEPGAFAAGFGAPDVIAFFAGHLLFGLAFTAIYGLLHRSGGVPVLF